MQFNRTKYATLQQAVDDFKDKIDAAAGDARLRYITSVPGQEAVYLQKASQATEYLSLLPTDMSNYGYVKREADKTGQSYIETATEIFLQAQAWGTPSEEIESERIAAKKNLDALDEQTHSIQDAVTIGYAAITHLKGI